LGGRRRPDLPRSRAIELPFSGRSAGPPHPTASNQATQRTCSRAQTQEMPTCGHRWARSNVALRHHLVPRRRDCMPWPRNFLLWRPVRGTPTSARCLPSRTQWPRGRPRCRPVDVGRPEEVDLSSAVNAAAEGEPRSHGSTDGSSAARRLPPRSESLLEPPRLPLDSNPTEPRSADASAELVATWTQQSYTSSSQIWQGGRCPAGFKLRSA
jgi:hypothetical protein